MFFLHYIKHFRNYFWGDWCVIWKYGSVWEMCMVCCWGGISHSIIWYCMVWSETQGIAWHGIVLGGIFWYSMLLTLGVFCYWEVWSSKTRLQWAAWTANLIRQPQFILWCFGFKYFIHFCEHTVERLFSTEHNIVSTYSIETTAICYRWYASRSVTMTFLLLPTAAVTTRSGVTRSVTRGLSQ